MSRLSANKVIAIINKIDLKSRVEKKEILKKFPNTVEVSAKKLKNLELLEDKIEELVYKGQALNPDSVLIGNLRHIQSLKKAQKHLAGALNSLDNKLSLEYVAQDVSDALGCLDDVLGKRFSEDVLDKIFSSFCIGK